jgi:excisionase family DNA binding protein
MAAKIMKKARPSKAPSAEQLPELISKNELIKYLKVSRPTLDRLMKQKAFPFIKLDRRVLFRKADIDRFLESKTVR